MNDVFEKVGTTNDPSEKCDVFSKNGGRRAYVKDSHGYHSVYIRGMAVGHRMLTGMALYDCDNHGVR